MMTIVMSKDRSKIVKLSVGLYPGRKDWFVRNAARYFRKHRCHTLLEPFAGTGIVGLSLLYAGIIAHLILVELDPLVVSLLQGMIADPTLADRFAAFKCTRENVEQLLATEDSAFSALVLSRVSNRAKWWGGKRPEIDCRWCPNVVLPNLQRVWEMRDRITVLHGDAFDVMPKYQRDPSVGSFCDPPYTADPGSKGHTIYPCHKINHPRLFSILADWRGPWVMTQDNTPAVRRLATCHRFRVSKVVMNTSDNIIKRELVISRKRSLF